MKENVKLISMKVMVVLAVTILFAISAMAKGGKEGPGSYTAPTITAEQAIAKVKAALPQLSVGKGFVKTGKQGEKTLEVMLVHGGQIVSRIKVNPSTGEIMPKGQKVFVQNVSASQEQAGNIVKEAIPKLEVGSVRLGKHGEWIIDLILNKVTVASIAVHGGNGSILPDWKASRDGAWY
jgi:hypothetical protein